MPEINHILLDMDGVISDFFSPAAKLVGVDVINYPCNQWEIADVAGISVSEFWGTIDREPGFWRNIKPYPWKDALIGFLQDLEIPWSICSTPARDPQCCAQKIEWLREHVAPNFTDFTFTKSKRLLANTHHLLIDDNANNVDSFVAAGGHAVLFPAIWNRLHEKSGVAFAHTLGEVARALDGSGIEVRIIPEADETLCQAMGIAGGALVNGTSTTWPVTGVEATRSCLSYAPTGFSIAKTAEGK